MKKLTLALLLSFTVWAAAQEPATPLSTVAQGPLETTDSPATTDETGGSIPATIRVDRPSFANSSNVVGPGVHSLEAGVLVTVNKGDPQALTQTPLLYRAGVSSDFEFRLATTGLNFKDTQSGWADLSPGFKWNFHADENVSASLIGSLTVPVGSQTFRPLEVTPSLSFAVDVPLGPRTGLLFNAGVNVPSSPGLDHDGNDQVIQPFATAGVAQTLSDKWAVYVEGAVFGPSAVEGATTTAGDVVFTYLLDNHTQFDFAVFKGFSSSGLDWAATLGMAHRF